MKGGVIRVALEEEDSASLAERLVEALRARGNTVERLNEDVLVDLGVEPDLKIAVNFAERLANLGIWTIVDGVNTPLDPPLHTVDVRIGRQSEEDALDLRRAAEVQPVFEAAARSPFMTPPVIILGKGGSGTRLLAEAFRAMGVFIGSKINETNDSLEMMDVGYVLLHEFASQIDLPSDLPEAAEEVRAAAVRMLARGPSPLGSPWGWKLPETMLILPLALQAFPHAKIVHLVRHPCGVTLKEDTHLTDRWSHHLGRTVLRGAAQYAGITEEEIREAPRYVRAAYSWVFQVKRVYEWCRENCAPGQYLELRVEDFARDTKATLKRIAEFVGVRWSPWGPAIDERRLKHWDPTSPEAAEVWKVAGETARKLGYGRP